MWVNRLTRFKSNNIYCDFIFRLIVLFLIVALLDHLIGNTLHYYYFRINHEENFRTTYVLEQTKADVLIFGSSRANHHYNAPLISQKLKLSCYNAGRDGNFIFYHYALLKGILKRYTPKIVILDLIAEDFYQEPKSYDRISCLLPYDHTHSELREITRMKSKYEKYKLLSRIYPFNSYLIRIITGNIDIHDKQKKELMMMGYKPLNKICNEPLQTVSDSFAAIDSNKIKIFNAFLHECKKANIELVVFNSPYYMKYPSTRKYIGIIKETTEQFNIPFWDYSQDNSFLNNPDWFGDRYHLNAKGADNYTELVIDKIIQSNTYSELVGMK